MKCQTSHLHWFLSAIPRTSGRNNFLLIRLSKPGCRSIFVTIEVHNKMWFSFHIKMWILLCTISLHTLGNSEVEKHVQQIGWDTSFVAETTQSPIKAQSRTFRSAFNLASLARRSDVEVNLLRGWESLRHLFEISNYWLMLALNLYRNKSSWARVRDRRGLWFSFLHPENPAAYWWPRRFDKWHTSRTIRPLGSLPVSVSICTKRAGFFLRLGKMLDFNIIESYILENGWHWVQCRD